MHLGGYISGKQPDGFKRRQLMKKAATISLILILVFTLAGCTTTGQTQQQKGTATGAAVGAGIGAILGQAIGKDTKGTVIGASIGAVVGGIAGNQIGAYMDRQEQELRTTMAASESASIRREQDVLVATFKSEVMFDYNSSDIKPGGLAEISRVATVLNNYPQTTIRVEGHTDAAGSEAYNQTLSEQRANSVRDALIQQNVDSGRITAIGFGETMPISSSDAANRRVELRITPIAAQQ
jgi:outer membrane protein OmpA-like peptidoglycan-associated protein